MSVLTQNLQTIPKAELHVHLRGMIQPKTVLELINKYGRVKPWFRAPARHLEIFNRYPNIAECMHRSHWDTHTVERFFRFSTFEQFLATWCFTGYLIHDIDDLYLLAIGALEYLKHEHVIYAEITVSPSEYLSGNLKFVNIVDTLHKAGTESSVHVQWIFDLVRDNGPNRIDSLLDELLQNRTDSIVGITLGGTEHRFPPAQFKDTYGKARRQGLHLTVHAGESMGPESIWDALTVLRVERIGHGVTSVDDPNLVTYIAEHGIPLEICPTSNIRTGLFPSLETHPITHLYKSGVPLTINSDDPAFFGTTITEEYLRLLKIGFTQGDVMQLIQNGFRYSFLPVDQSASYIRTVEKRISDLSRSDGRER